MRKITDISIKTNTFVTCIILPETKYTVEVTFDDGSVEKFATMFFVGAVMTPIEAAVDFLKSWLKTDRTSFSHEGSRLILQNPNDKKSSLSLC